MKSNLHDVFAPYKMVSRQQQQSYHFATNQKQMYLMSERETNYLNQRRIKGFCFLKNSKSLNGYKFYLSLPSLSREEKATYLKLISENGGVIKSNITNVGENHS